MNIISVCIVRLLYSLAWEFLPGRNPILHYATVRFVLQMHINMDAAIGITPCRYSYSNFVKMDRGIQNMTSRAGVSWTIWWDFRFSGQPEILLEFLSNIIIVPWPDYSMLLVEVSACLCHVFLCSVWFFNCINLYAVAISNK